jgi:hypothetical protein
MVFYEEARVNFDLLWNYLAGGMSFLPIRYLKERTYEGSASIEIDPVGIARDPYLKLFSQSQRIIYYETMNF